MADDDEGVIDLALARVQIQSVVAGVEVGDPNLACTVIEARVQKCMRKGAVGEWRWNRAAMPMAPRVRNEVGEEAAGEWRGSPWD